MKKFWIVMNAVETRHAYGRTYYRHKSKEDADREARRLSHKYRSTFMVLETVDAYRQPVPDAERVALD
jgi:hypothetical protein